MGLKIQGWRRPIGCLKLQVIFRKRATNYRALLRKMTYKDKASYDSSPPCTQFSIVFDAIQFEKWKHAYFHIYIYIYIDTSSRHGADDYQMKFFSFDRGNSNLSNFSCDRFFIRWIFHWIGFSFEDNFSSDRFFIFWPSRMASLKWKIPCPIINHKQRYHHIL